MERSLYDQELYERKLIKDLKLILHEVKENRKTQQAYKQVVYTNLIRVLEGLLSGQEDE